MAGQRRSSSPVVTTAAILALMALAIFLYLLATTPNPPSPVAVGTIRAVATPTPAREETPVESPRRVPIPITPAPEASAEPSPPRPTPVPVRDFPTPEPPPDSATVNVSVVDSRGRAVSSAIIQSLDCDIWRNSGSGRERIVISGEDLCSFRGGRRDGALVAWSDEVLVDLSGGGSRSVTLSVPEERTAGMGLQITSTDRGILVQRVIPGSPADQAGLVPGDLILSINGEETSALSVQEFVTIGTGPAGTQVGLVLLRETDSGIIERRVQLTRQLIEE